MSHSGLPTFSSTFSLIWNGINPTVDLVAVENLSQFPLDCWSGPDETNPSAWLSNSEFLPKTIPYARIFNFGYVLEDRLDVRRIGETLLKELKAHRQEVSF
jgi:hypothetical protein